MTTSRLVKLVLEFLKYKKPGGYPWLRPVCDISKLNSLQAKLLLLFSARFNIKDCH